MKKILLLFLSMLYYSLPVAAQTLISGRLIDAVSRQPLEAANIRVEKTNISAVSDKYGNFSLRVHEGDTITASYIGYKQARLVISDTPPLLLTLMPDVANLEDITITQSSAQQNFAALAKIDLNLKPVRNSQELLRIVPGLFIAQHAGGGKAEQIFLRGFDCDHGTDVQVSVDGIPVNMVSHAHGQGYADSHFIIPETINNIDYGTGPYYAQRGDLNTAGYVSFSTYDNIPQSLVQLEAGRFNTFRTLAIIDLVKKNKDRQSAYMAGDFYYTDGPTVSKQALNRFNLFGKYNLAISSNDKISASLSAFKSRWNASGQVPARAVESGLISRFGSLDPSEGGNTERYNANIIFTHRFKSGATWENQAYYTHYIFNLYSDFSFYLEDSINGDEINQAEKRNLFGVLSKLNHKASLFNRALNSDYGVGLRGDATDSSKLAHVVKRQFLNYTKLGNIKETNAFAYTEQELVAGKWLIKAGVRVDHFHFSYFDLLSTQQLPAQSKSAISPKVNIQYTVSNKMQLYAKAGKGFHSNDARAVIENNGYEVLPAAYGADLGIVLKPDKNLVLHAAIWCLYLDQEFVYVGDEGNIEPGGKTRREGVDILARYQFTKNLYANTNVNFTRPRASNEPKGQNFIPLAPTTTSTGGIFYRPKYGFNGSLTYRYIKDRPANEDNSIVAKGYFLLDGSFNYTKPKYEAGISFENIFNANWNEAQFATTSRLKGEAYPVTDLNFTPGFPFYVRAKFSIFF